MIESTDYSVQNLYLGILNDMCERTCCRNYLFSWRRADKKRSLLSLLAEIWRKEEQVFKVERSPEGCVKGAMEYLDLSRTFFFNTANGENKKMFKKFYSKSLFFNFRK